MKRGYVVYRVDSVTGRKEAIGCMLERRERERAKNLAALIVASAGGNVMNTAGLNSVED